MSEASRQRWLRVKNCLEELRSKYGDPPEQLPDWLDHAPLNTTPSWGPVGSLAERMMDSWEFGRLLEQHGEVVRMERSTRATRGEPVRLDNPPATEKTPSEPPASKRVLRLAEALQTLDQYGETPLSSCEQCDEESAKASVRLGLWHCTACDTWGKVARPHQRREVWEREPL